MFKQTIRELIARNDTKLAIIEMQKLSSFEEAKNRNSVIVLSAQYHNLEERENLGITRRDEAVSELARIHIALLHILDELPDGSFHSGEVEKARLLYLEIKDLDRESRFDIYEKIFNVLDKYKNSPYITPHTCEILGLLYKEGLGTVRNELMAYSMYKKSSDGDFEWGHYGLGEIYLGRNEYKKAETYLRKAALMGVGWAYIKIGDLYRDSLGVKQDYSKALEFYMKGNITVQI